MKTILLGTYNPNVVRRNEVYNAVVATRPHASWTPSKREKLNKEDRRKKQRGWC